MFEAMFGIWFLVVGSLWTVGFLTLFVLWLVHEESDGWAIAWMIALGAIVYHIFQVDTMTLLVSAAAYIPIGIMWSFYRWKRFCNKEVQDYNDRKDQRVSTDEVQGIADLAHWTERNLDSLKSTVSPGNNITRLVNWIVIWPFSVVENVLGDIYDAIVRLVKNHLVNLYSKISSNALNNVK